MRSISVWKGSLTFGLVNINIELYSAIASHSLGFKLLHLKCKQPVSYQRWCHNCNEEVAWEAIVKGFKLEDGSFFILTKENLEKLKPEKTDYISVIEFVETKKLEPIYFDQHYYIAPAKGSDKAFFLFVKTLEKLDRIAIGQFVLRDKEYVCAIQHYENGLLLTTLNYDYEIKQVAKFEELKEFKVDAAELKLATQLVDELTVDKFDMSRFKDTFAEELKKKIKQAAKGIKVTPAKEQKKEKVKEGSLLETLQASLRVKKTNTPELRASAKSKKSKSAPVRNKVKKNAKAQKNKAKKV